MTPRPASPPPSRVAARALLPLLGLSLGLLAACQRDAAITGTVTYREKIALPGDAVVEVTLQDVSHADAAATVLGRVRLEDVGQPPVAFTLPYDPAAIDSTRRYAVRARITAGKRLLFVTDRRYPVLTGGHGDRVQLVLALTRGAVPAEGADASRAWRGMVTGVPEAPVFRECGGAGRWPLAREGDYVALERAVLATRPRPPHGLLATFAGRVVSRARPGAEAPGQMVVVDRFLGVWPGETCGNPGAVASLQDTYWKLTRLRGQPVRVLPGRREPHLVLHAARGRLAGSGGCNRLGGRYTLRADTLRFEDVTTAGQACPGGMAQEAALVAALREVVTWELTGVHLELRAADGRTLLRLEERPLY
jgi:uncharacterized lipoprotein YbaY/heat shock protein HslJ